MVITNYKYAAPWLNTFYVPRASIIIRAFNEAQHIGRLLDGIQKQTEQDVEIILVDSGSTDDTVAIAQKYPVKVVTIRPEEFTFGCSLNLGIAQAAGEFVVMASAHVYPVDENWIKNLLSPFEDAEVALSYGAQRGADTTKFSEHQHFYEWFPAESNFIQEHPFCNNANAAIRRALWEQHPYDETLTGLEDIAWASWAWSRVTNWPMLLKRVWFMSTMNARGRFTIVTSARRLPSNRYCRKANSACVTL